MSSVSMKTPKRKRVAAVAAKAIVPAVAAIAIEQPVNAAEAPCDADCAATVSLDAEPVMREAAALESTAVLEAPAASSSDPIVALPSNSTVKDAAALKTALLKVVELTATVALDVRSVERVDTATLQLLCAFVRDRAARNLGVQWLGCPPAIFESAGVLGVQSMLALPAAGVA